MKKKKAKSKKTVAIGIALALTITMLTSIGVASAIPFIDFDGTIWSACAYSGTLPPFCGVESGPPFPNTIKCYGFEDPTQYWSYTHLFNGSGSAIAFNELPSLEGEALSSVTMTATGGFNANDFQLTDFDWFYTDDETFIVQTFSGGNVSIYLDGSEILTIADATVVLTSNLCTQEITGYGEGTITGVHGTGLYDDFTGYSGNNDISIKVLSMNAIRLPGEDPADFLFTLRIIPTLPVHNFDSGEDFATIQEAIDDFGTEPGHTITVDPGTYNENVVVNKRLTINSSSGNPADTIVNASVSNDHVFTVTVDYVNISGFTVENATSFGMARISGIYLYNVEHCNISDNTVSNNDIGILLNGSSYNNLTNNNVSDNDEGIYLESSSYNTLTKNTANSNTWCGIFLYDSSNNNNITCNWVAHNGESGFRLTVGSTGNNISYNNIIANGVYNETSGGYEWQLYNDQDDDVEAKNNYWGTANSAVIAAGIKANPGAVDFEPFLTEPAPCAPGLPSLPPYTHTDVGVTVDIKLSEPGEIEHLLPPGTDISNAIVITVNVTDDTPENPTDDAYTDITINVGELDVETCEVFKEGSDFLPEVDDVTTLPTVKPPGVASFSRDVANNSVIVRLYVGDPLLGVIPLSIEGVFDTDKGTYPSIMGTHEGTIIPSRNISVSKLYTYPCAGTGGHTEYVRFYGNGLDVNKTWNGYGGDYHNIIFDPPITLQANTPYNYEIRTGSYPQIIHEQCLPTANGTINCTRFTDANGKTYNDWIPAIKLE